MEKTMISFRCSRELYEAAILKARLERTPLSSILRELLSQWVAEGGVEGAEGAERYGIYLGEEQKPVSIRWA